MRFTREVAWDAADFGVAAALVLLAGGAAEALARRAENVGYLLGSAVAVGAASG